MPVRSLKQSVLRWPSPEEVLEQLRHWALAQQQQQPTLLQVGVFGIYGRGTASVGSDLDLVLVETDATGTQSQRLLKWPLDQLPLSCDALVLNPDELQQLLDGGTRMAAALKSDLRWIL
jgi:predicted nucleotidyltransferase